MQKATCPSQTAEKTSNLTLVGPKSVMAFTMLYAHYPKKRPAQVKRQRKSSQVAQHRRKKVK